MSKSFTVHIFALAAGLACAASAYAADTSTERTTMPDHCTQRDVNCVIPDNTTPIRSAVGAAPVNSTGTTPPPVGSTTAPPGLTGTNRGAFGTATPAPTSSTTTTTGGGALR